MFHFHRDPNYRVRGVWRYERCRCGARRLRRVYFGGMSPVVDGWQDLLRDRHGQVVDDSGWVRTPILEVITDDGPEVS